MKRKTAALAALLISAASAFAIEIPDSTYSYSVEASATLSSGDQAPFWLVNNRFGLSSLDKSHGYLRAGAFRHERYDRRFDWEAGVDLVLPYNFSSHFVVQQLYAGVRYRSLNLVVGSKEWSNGIVDRELSSGDMLFSTNARPVPQVRIEMPEYRYIPYTKNFMAVRGYFSVGMYSDWRFERSLMSPSGGDWIEHRLFHSKGLFLRGGDPARHDFTVEGGLEMGAQWGGTLHYTDDEGNRCETTFPHGFKDFWKVFIPRSGGNYNDPGQGGEIANCLGNHLGQWSLAVNWKPRNMEWGARLYYEHFFGDHSMMFFDHAWKDMLLGVVVSFPKNPVVSDFLYEYLITKDQSGPVYWDSTPEIPTQVSGCDGYYNHQLYTSWQHWGLGQGNPLLVSPLYNTDGTWEFNHSRIKGHHFGWRGEPMRDLDYRVLLTYTRSWGSYTVPTRSVLHNFNALLEVNYHPSRFSGWNGRLSIAADGGRLLGKSFGAMLTISKSGWL